MDGWIRRKRWKLFVFGLDRWMWVLNTDRCRAVLAKWREAQSEAERRHLPHVGTPGGIWAFR
jgi:hypothetical protein